MVALDIRRPREDERAALGRIHVAALGLLVPDFGAAVVARWQSSLRVRPLPLPLDRVRAAFSGARPVGFGWRDERGLIRALFVRPSWRLEGVGARLLSALLDMTELPATVEAAPSAVGFYAARGFAELGARPLLDGGQTVGRVHWMIGGRAR